MKDIYSEIILDHWKHPKNKGRIEADIVSRDSNLLCGDEVIIYIKLDGDRIKNISFEGSGCVISQAAASMLTEMMKGKTLQDVVKLEKGDIEKRLQVNLGPNRVKCALLPLKALKLGVYSYLGKRL
jgi:nitrogen fixation NifU-like protein